MDVLSLASYGLVQSPDLVYVPCDEIKIEFEPIYVDIEITVPRLEIEVAPT